MLDALFIVLSILFVVATVYVRGCERLRPAIRLKS